MMPRVTPEHLPDSSEDRPTTALQEALAHCRRGSWSEGYRALNRAVESGEAMTPLARSYLGYLVAARDGRFWEGLDLCRQAAEERFFQPEVQVNLARTYLLRERRHEAVAALSRALEIDPGFGPAIRLRQRLGTRSRPSIPFLGRSNPINHLFGRLRAALRA